MPRQGEIINDDNIDEGAFSTARAKKRFEVMHYYNNSTKYRVNLSLFQGIQKEGEIPDGYVERTGVTVDGINVTPGTHSSTAIQANINCLATYVECSIEFKHLPSGKTGKFDHSPKIASPGKYFRSVSFGIKDPDQETVGDSEFPIVISNFELDDLPE